VPSVGRDGRSRGGETLGTQQQMMPKAISIGEKHTRHQEAPMGSEVTSPKTLIAQSMRRTARMVQLLGVLDDCGGWGDYGGNLQASKQE